MAVWKLLDSYRECLIFQSQKFQHEKRLFESDRAAALKEIHLDLQSKLESLVSKLDEASKLLQSKTLQIFNQSNYINSLEDKLRSHVEKTVITEETTGSLSELMQHNSLLKSAFEVSQMELQSLVEHRKNDKLFYENRISQLEMDVIRLEKERDTWLKKVHPPDQPESCLQTGMDVLLPNVLPIKKRDNEGESANSIVYSEPLDDVNKQLDPSDSSGSKLEDPIPSSETPHLDSLDRDDEIIHVIETFSSQFTMALGTYNKIIYNLYRMEYPRSVWAQAELRETCNTNLQCLDAMLSVLKSGCDNVGD